MDNNNQKCYGLSSKSYFLRLFSEAVFYRTFMFSIFKNRDFRYLVCVSAKSCSLTLYEFFNRQDLSAIETERNAVFYSKHTAGSPI